MSEDKCGIVRALLWIHTWSSEIEMTDLTIANNRASNRFEIIIYEKLARLGFFIGLTKAIFSWIMWKFPTKRGDGESRGPSRAPRRNFLAIVD